MDHGDVAGALVSKPSDEVRELRVPFDSLPSLIGRPFLGMWHTVDAAKLPLFDAVVCTDQNEYAFDSDGYPKDLVEGFHLLAMLDHLFNPLLRVTDRTCVVWNYGFDRVRFVSPVCAGEEFRVAGSVGDVKAKEGGFVVLSKCTVEVKGRDRPGMVADWWTYWLPGSVGTPGSAGTSGSAGNSGAATSARHSRSPAPVDDNGMGPAVSDA